MDTTKSAAWSAAKAEGLSYFWANMHVGHSLQFVGHCWEDGGFTVDEAGHPVRDCNGNTVAKFDVECLDPALACHHDQVAEWYG